MWKIGLKVISTQNILASKVDWEALNNSTFIFNNFFPAKNISSINKNNLRAWQKLIGYVPQHIYLSDDTVAANIAFGIDLDEIDYNAVEKASKIANLHEFVINELPKQYNTTIGERGVRLSGGQRQRIGIARALYRKAEILILDEATSSLDKISVKKINNNLKELSKKITIIMISHQLEDLQVCDEIYKIHNKKLSKLK